MSSRILILDYGIAVHAAHRAAGQGSAGLLGDSSAESSLEWIRDWNPTESYSAAVRIRFSGRNAALDPAILDIAPILGICYGMQLIAYLQAPM